jgi:hypothetical protein
MTGTCGAISFTLAKRTEPLIEMLLAFATLLA